MIPDRRRRESHRLQMRAARCGNRARATRVARDPVVSEVADQLLAQHAVLVRDRQVSVLLAPFRERLQSAAEAIARGPVNDAVARDLAYQNLQKDPVRVRRVAARKSRAKLT
jgi:hypothetical protein